MHDMRTLGPKLQRDLLPHILVLRVWPMLATGQDVWKGVVSRC